MSKPMTKTQLVAAVAEAMGSDKKTASAALDAIASVVATEVAAGGSITLPGLGKVACGRADAKACRQAGQVRHRQGAERRCQRLTLCENSNS